MLVRTFPLTATPVPANVVDVSRSGMKLQLVTPLERDTRIEVTMLASKAVVSAEVRYCRRSGAVYHAGVLIEDVIQPKPDTTHLHDEELALYVVGKGLTATEVLRVETHIFRCDSCKLRMVQAATTMYPRQRRLNIIGDDK